MRLLDIVAHSAATPTNLPQGWGLPVPAHFAEAVRSCPLRLVLADDLVRCSTALGFAEGDRLSDCADLVRVPSERMWIEWSDAPRQSALRDVTGMARHCLPSARRAGVLLQSDSSGRAGTLRTFWSSAEDRAYCAAMITEFDLDHPVRDTPGHASVFQGGHAGVCMSDEAAIDSVLAHMRFRLDPAWIGYYRAANLSAAEQNAILRALLATSSFDLPMLFALFLLMAAKDGAQTRHADLGKLNRVRRASGKFELLDHVEVSSRIFAASPARGRGDADALNRHHRRLHHVRGHLARRGHTVYWRSPHLRGNARVGVIKSRTVELSFH